MTEQKVRSKEEITQELREKYPEVKEVKEVKERVVKSKVDTLEEDILTIEKKIKPIEDRLKKADRISIEANERRLTLLRSELIGLNNTLTRARTRERKEKQRKEILKLYDGLEWFQEKYKLPDSQLTENLTVERLRRINDYLMFEIYSANRKGSPYDLPRDRPKNSQLPMISAETSNVNLTSLLRTMSKNKRVVNDKTEKD